MNNLVLNDGFESGSLRKDNRAVPFSADLCAKKNDRNFGGRFSSGRPHLAGADQFVQKYIVIQFTNKVQSLACG